MLALLKTTGEDGWSTSSSDSEPELEKDTIEFNKALENFKHHQVKLTELREKQKLCIAHLKRKLNYTPCPDANFDPEVALEQTRKCLRTLEGFVYEVVHKYRANAESSAPASEPLV